MYSCERMIDVSACKGCKENVQGDGGYPVFPHEHNKGSHLVHHKALLTGVLFYDDDALGLQPSLASLEEGHRVIWFSTCIMFAETILQAFMTLKKDTVRQEEKSPLNPHAVVPALAHTQQSRP